MFRFVIKGVISGLQSTKYLASTASLDYTIFTKYRCFEAAFLSSGYMVKGTFYRKRKSHQDGVEAGNRHAVCSYRVEMKAVSVSGA